MDIDFLSTYPRLQEMPSLVTTLQFLKLVVFDVDGVLTDGGLLYDGLGESIKKFNVKDGVAIKLLPKWGVQVAFITAKASAPLQHRMSDLEAAHFYSVCHDKTTAFDDIIATLQLEPEQAAYVGDDVIDLPVMLKVGVALCPSDAHVLLQRYCHLVLNKRGGQGVAREMADLVLASRMLLENAYEVTQTPEFEKK